MQIAVITYWAVTNVGDRILTDTVCWMLRQRGHTVRILDIQARYAYKFSGFLGWIERRLSDALGWSCRGVERYYKEGLRGCDAVVFGGGEILAPDHEIVNSVICEVVKDCELLQIPVYFHSIGVAHCPNTVLSGPLSKALSSPVIRSFTVRESAELFNKTFLNGSVHRAEWVCDTAVWSAEAYGVKRRKRSTGRICVGVNIIYPEAFAGRGISVSAVLMNYCQVVSALSDCGFDVVLFNNGVKRCEQAMEEIADRMAGRCKIDRMVGVRSGKRFVEFLSGLDCVVSSRLHTSICAYSLEIPTVAISWDDKIEFFYNSLNAGEQCFDWRHDTPSDVVTTVSRITNGSPVLLENVEYRRTVKDAIARIGIGA